MIISGFNGKMGNISQLSIFYMACSAEGGPPSSVPARSVHEAGQSQCRHLQTDLSDSLSYKFSSIKTAVR